LTLRVYFLRGFAGKVALESSTGWHIRYVPAELARAMVDAGHAEIAHQNGRIRSIKLLTTAATHARPIGPPTVVTAPETVRFTRREMLDESGTRVWQHHPRATYSLRNEVVFIRSSAH
jgi:hypothetical protein